MDAGDTPTCTFTNSLKPKLKVVKATVPTNDPGKFDFTIAGSPHNNSGAGYGNGQGTGFITLDAGNVTISETAHTGTSLTDYTAELACDNEKEVDPNGGSSGTVNLAYGDVITCTFTNTRNATLDIEKVTVGGVGDIRLCRHGTGVTASFSRTTTSIGVATTSAPFVIAKATFGTKYVAGDSAGQLGNHADIDCDANGAVVVIGSGGSGAFDAGATNGYDTGDNTVKVTVDAGDNPTCTFTNTKVASLDIEKISKDATGTFNFDATGLSDFSRTTTTEDVATTYDPFTIGVANFGLKYVEETVPAGWAVTDIQCTENGAVIRIGHGSGLGFVAGATNDWDEGDNSVEVSIGSGDEPTCTFTNRLKPKLTVAKATVPTTDGGKFDFTVAGTPHTNSGAGYGNGQSASNIILDPGSVTISEAGHSPTDLDDYVPALACVGKTVSSNTGSSGSITLGYGDNITCTFTNTKKGSITIVKDADPNNAQDFSFTASGTGMTPATFELDDDGETAISARQHKFSRLVPGGAARTVTEVGEDGWTVIDIACIGADNSTVLYGADGDFDDGDKAVSITVGAGDDITCTFKNGVADLTVAKSHTGNFVFGTNGSYSIVVSNDGTGPTVGTVTMTDVLPSLLSYVSAAGTGWTCGHATGTVTCTRTVPIADGADAPTITLTVAPTGAGTTTNTASVSGGGEIKTDNNESQIRPRSMPRRPLRRERRDCLAAVQRRGDAEGHHYSPHDRYQRADRRRVSFYLRAAAVLLSCLEAVERIRCHDDITAAEERRGAGRLSGSPCGRVHLRPDRMLLSLEPDFAKSGDTESPVAVGKEDASVGPTSPPSATSFPVASGQTTTTVTMTFLVREKNPEPDQNAGALPGDIDNTGLTVSLTAVGSAANDKPAQACTPSAPIATPPAYAGRQDLHLYFHHASRSMRTKFWLTVTGYYYVGSYDDAITVYDPAAGFVTGGGRIELPAVREREPSHGARQLRPGLQLHREGKDGSERQPPGHPPLGER